MNKFERLRLCAQGAGDEALDLEAIRLYLLLVAASGRSGEGRIDSAAMRRALGRSPADQEEAIRVLAGRRLIEVLGPPDRVGRQATFHYRLLPVTGDRS